MRHAHHRPAAPCFAGATGNRPKPCPLCGGEIHRDAQFCKHCKRPLNTPAPAPPMLTADPISSTGSTSREPDCHLLPAASGGSARWRNIGAILFAILSVIAIIARCNQSHEVSQHEQMLNDVSGVWTCAGDNALVSIDLAGDNKVITINDKAFPVHEITQFDTDNDTLTLDVGNDNQPVLWTIKQLWDSDKKHFSLHLTLQDGTNDNLNFVRNL